MIYLIIQLYKYTIISYYLLNASARNPKAATFEEGEKILAFHGPQIYEGKVCMKKEIVFYNYFHSFLFFLSFNLGATASFLQHTQTSICIVFFLKRV